MRRLGPWPLLALALVVVVGTFWAYSRGGQDFAVFYHAWRLVLEGRGAEIYVNSPDRFLYAPGFAWLLAPMAWLPQSVALGLWTLLKALALGSVVRAFAQRLRLDTHFSVVENYRETLTIAAIGALLWTKPLLIDFQYGQINVLIMTACVWALLVHLEGATGHWKEVLSWAVLCVAAIAKLFPLPLLLIPFVATRGLPKGRLWRERAGILVGAAVLLLLPMLGHGWSGALELYRGWMAALVAKGLPLESHNQSFVSFLYHYFSGTPVSVLAEARQIAVPGFSILGPVGISLLTTLWSAGFLGLTLFLVMVPARFSGLTWLSLLTAMVFMPSHLIWKTYFVMAIPLAILFVKNNRHRPRLLLFLFMLVNMTGYDFVGHEWGAWLESAALPLWVTVAIVITQLQQATKVSRA